MTVQGRQWYADYLRSDHWKKTRAAKLEAASNTCERCGEHGKRALGWVLNLHVHHLTYERVWNEELSDLQVLCVACHEEEHGIAAADESRRHELRVQASSRIAGYTTGYTRDDIDLEIEAWDGLAEAAGF